MFLDRRLTPNSFKAFYHLCIITNNYWQWYSHCRVQIYRDSFGPKCKEAGFYWACHV